MPIPNLLPVSSFDMVFAAVALAPRTMTFKAVESKESRNIGFGHEIVYDVFADPPNEELFTDYLYNDAERIFPYSESDEVVIGWNTWLRAGESFYDGTLAKKWPPACTRIRHNEYKVVITYAPLYIVDFNINPVKVKKQYAYWAEAWNLINDEYKKVDVENLADGTIKTAHHSINVDKSAETGKIQGIDVIEPSFSWTERWTWGPVSRLAWMQDHDNDPDTPMERYDYFDELAKTTATVNSAPFRGYPAGEILFQGASGRYASPMTWEIDYHFSRRPNRNEITIADLNIDVPEGHQSGWMHIEIQGQTKDITDITGVSYLREMPKVVRLHQVYKDGEFERLRTVPSLDLGFAHHLAAINRWPGGVLPSIGLAYLPPISPVLSS